MGPRVRVLLLFALLSFTLDTQAQTISSITPSSGAPGTQITITGTGLLSQPVGYGHDLVIGGAPRPTIVSWTDTQIIAILPSTFEGNTNTVSIFTSYMSEWDDYTSNIVYWTILAAPITSISPVRMTHGFWRSLE